MSANLMVRPCSCPARDTLCSGGQMLSMSQMGHFRKSALVPARSVPPPCVDGSELARTFFTSQVGRCGRVFGL